MSGVDWLAALGRLGSEDLRRISRLVDLMTTADRAAGERARAMLGATPEPWTHEEARARCNAIIRYLERSSADAANALDTVVSLAEKIGADVADLGERSP